MMKFRIGVALASVALLALSLSITFAWATPSDAVALVDLEEAASIHGGGECDGYQWENGDVHCEEKTQMCGGEERQCATVKYTKLRKKKDEGGYDIPGDWVGVGTDGTSCDVCSESACSIAGAPYTITNCKKDALGL
ncbi:MAG: hypothetical protein KF708_16415 [Pirellulales bacterium]|nr:hypothetical protein [Pirellulales bacterium]